MTGKPAARALTDGHTEGVILEGSHDVLINNKPAARLGDEVQHGDGTCTITQGSSAVLINNKPAARMGDSLSCGDAILSGSSNVLIGTHGGVACVSCTEKKVGHPINPENGTKVLTRAGEVDFTMPGAVPVIWSRFLSTFINPELGAICGALGYLWYLPEDFSLQLRENSTLLFDNSGRTITFVEALRPGEILYSRSEDIYLLRGGVANDGELPKWRADPRFKHIDEKLAANENIIIGTTGVAHMLWVFSPKMLNVSPQTKKNNSNNDANSTHQGEVKSLKKRWTPSTKSKTAPNQIWLLRMKTDRLGRSQTFQYSAEGKFRLTRGAMPAGKLISMTDGAGRHYRMHYKQIHKGRKKDGYWNADDGWRLVSIEIDYDPINNLTEKVILVRYVYNPQGQLISVIDREGELAREFEWTQGRISAHRYYGGPWHRYKYAGAEPDVRVVEHSNEVRLTYIFYYRKEEPTAAGVPRNTTTVTDSLNRVEEYCFEGEAGLSRLVKHRRADCSVVLNKFDGFGRLYARIDPISRTTYLRFNGSGSLMGTQQPDNSRTNQEFDKAGYITESEDAAEAVTRFDYEAYQRLSTITFADGTFQRYHYPDLKVHPQYCENPIRIEDQRGGETHQSFNEAGQLIRHTDCSGSIREWVYDQWGLVIGTTDAEDGTVRFKRNNTGRIIETHLPNNVVLRHEYDSRGRPTRIYPSTTKAADSFSIEYDLWGRTTRIVQGDLSIQFKYDIAGRLESITNENGAQSFFFYDLMDRIIKEIGFDVRVKRYTYDLAGQLTSIRDGTGDNQTDLLTTLQYNRMGWLIEKIISATAAAPAQRHCLEWDKVGRLTAASVYVIVEQQPGDLQVGDQKGVLQSRIEIELDKLGRVTGEVQRLYKPGPNGTPIIEYEHRITHQLNPLGNRLSSQLQHFGGIEWLQYGSGHVHGLMHEGQILINFERDKLHREIKHTYVGAHPDEESLTLSRNYDAQGRLGAVQLHGLDTEKISSIDPSLTGQLLSRTLHYDNSNQIIKIELPDRIMCYGNDDAGRLKDLSVYNLDHYLKAPAGSAIPMATKNWKTDPAGNRLPAKVTAKHVQQQNWADMAHKRWQDPTFNLLGESEIENTDGTYLKWMDNRISFSEDWGFKYDLWGNRISKYRLKLDTNDQCFRQNFGYNGSHQLIRVEVIFYDGSAETSGTTVSQFVYDAKGRRLKKIITDQAGVERITYFGWDGNRLVHTEKLNDDGMRDAVHIIYEPGSFTPLIRLSRSVTPPIENQHYLVRAIGAGFSNGKTGTFIKNNELESMQLIINKLPPNQQKILENSMRSAFEKINSGHVIGNIGPVLESTPIMDMVNGLQALEQKEQSKIEINFFHCDHLGTPIGLTDAKHNLFWASRMDPWGNNEEEFNPKNIDQAIGLPGQYYDRETDLYYNLHRYYDPDIGSYINQDPIGLKGALNFYAYSRNQPLKSIDPLGLYGASTSSITILSYLIGLYKFDVRPSKLPAPPGSKQCSYDGKVFYAPPDANFEEVYNAGRNSALSYTNEDGLNLITSNDWILYSGIQTQDLIGIFGKYNYQRDAPNNVFTPQYTDASNFIIGVFMAGAGISENDMIGAGISYAKLTKSTGDINKKIEFWKTGFKAANEGKLGCCN